MRLSFGICTLNFWIIVIGVMLSLCFTCKILQNVVNTSIKQLHGYINIIFFDFLQTRYRFAVFQPESDHKKLNFIVWYKQVSCFKLTIKLNNFRICMTLESPVICLSKQVVLVPCVSSNVTPLDCTIYITFSFDWLGDDLVQEYRLSSRTLILFCVNTIYVLKHRKTTMYHITSTSNYDVTYRQPNKIMA